MNNINKTIISEFNGKYVLICIENDKMNYIRAYKDLNSFTVGTIVNARITKCLDNINSSFLRYSENGYGFINKKIKPESVIALQYKKEPSGEKKALFSDKLTFEGDYAVVSSGDCCIKISSKIPGDKAEKLKKVFSDTFSDSRVEIIVRTKAGESEDNLKKALDEAHKYVSLIEKINEDFPNRPQYTLFYTPVPEIVSDICRCIDLNTEEIVTDDKNIYDLLKKEIPELTGSENESGGVNIRFYNDKLLPLCKLYSFDAKISEVLSRKINLKSGAYITFDTTEALTAIDVNTAGAVKGKTDKEDMFLNINLEALSEIKRQIRLRNISGIIIIDFINMKSDESYQVLSDAICKAVSEDDVTTDFYGFTGLKLAEISRQKKRNSFYYYYKD